MSDNAQHGRMWTVAKYPLAFISLLVLGLPKLAKWLGREAYGGWDNWWHRIWGFVSALVAGSGTFYFLSHGGELGFPLWGANAYLSHAHAPIVALEFGAGAFLLTAVYLFPMLWLAALKWVWTAWKMYYTRVYKLFTRNVGGAGTYERNGTRMARRLTGWTRILPGTKNLWELVVKEQNDSFFIGFQSLCAYAVVVLASAGVTYWLYSVVAPFVAAPTALAALGKAGFILLAVLVFGLILNPLWRIVDTGKTYVLGVMISAVAGWGAFRSLTAFDAAVPLAVAVSIVAAWLFDSYVYPAGTLALTDGIIKKLYKLLRPMVESVYSEKETGFRQLVHQILNLLGTAAASALVVVLWHAVQLPFMPNAFGTAPHIVAIAALGWLVILPVVAFTAYCLIGEALDWTGGNIIVGAVTALGTGGIVATELSFGSWPHLLLLTVPATFATFLFTLFIAFPIAYGILRALAELPLLVMCTNGLGGFLHGMHKTAWKAFDKVIVAERQMYTAAYKDQTLAFRQLANHAANIVASWAVAGGTFYLLTSFGYSHLVTWSASIVLLMLSYLLGKRLVFRNSLQPIGSVKAILKAIIVGACLRHATVFGLWFSIPVALVAAAFVYFIFFPLVYIICRKALDPWFTDWAVPKLDATYNFFWRRFGFIVRWSEAVADFLEPYFHGGMRFLTSGWNLCLDAWSSVFGGSRKG